MSAFAKRDHFQNNHRLSGLSAINLTGRSLRDTVPNVRLEEQCEREPWRARGPREWSPKGQTAARHADC